ncbi:MAG: hypothetical protein HYR51_06085 [Candidatus Rokubacteria bacterium]|nr:hypothetical protein [Candidatus Rokubacteria bacterium]
MTTWAIALVGAVSPMRALVRGRLVGTLAREFQIWRWRRVRRPERLGPRARPVR